MTRYVSNPGILVFRSGTDTILSSSTAVLKFFNEKMASLLVEAIKAMRNPCTLAELQEALKAQKFHPENTKQVFETLQNYGLIVEHRIQENPREPIELVAVDEFGIELHDYLAPMNRDFNVTLRAIEQPTQWQPTGEGRLPIFLFPYYNRTIFLELNRKFLAEQQRWMLLFHHKDQYYLIGFIPGSSSCFECLAPLTINDFEVSNVDMYTGAATSAADTATVLAFLFRSIQRCFVGGDTAYSHIEKLHRHTLERRSIRRIHQPQCPACGGGGLRR